MSEQRDNTVTSRNIDKSGNFATNTNADEDMFALSFANHSMEMLVDNPPELLSSNNSLHDENDYAMTFDLDSATIVTPENSFVVNNSNGRDNTSASSVKRSSNSAFDLTTDSGLSSSRASYESILDSYANVAQQNYKLWLSSF